MSKSNGVVLWEGVSKLDGKSPLVCIATFKTSNEKTGSMVQTWIIRSDINPVEASKQSIDDATCGSCIHRHSLDGSCYVNIGQAPNAVYKAYKRGSYPHVNDDDKHIKRLKGRAIRFGAYGDPAAILQGQRVRNRRDRQNLRSAQRRRARPGGRPFLVNRLYAIVGIPL